MAKQSSRYTIIAIDIATMIINGELLNGKTKPTFNLNLLSGE